MNAARKRVPGPGRKPKGDKAMPSFTWRMPADVRSQLEAAAKKAGLNLSDELLRRLRASFSREYERRHDPATKALTFLISQAVLRINLSSRPKPQWHRDPFCYQAFRIAVDKILATFEPPGEIVSPHEETAVHMENQSGWGKEFGAKIRKEFKTPESAAALAADLVLTEYFLGVSSLDDVQRKAGQLGWGPMSPETKDFYNGIIYGMSNAREDLGVKLEDVEPQDGES
jgi:hypothetical protein